MTRHEISLRTRNIGFVVVLLLLANVVLAFSLFSRAEEAISDLIRSRMLDISKTAAALLEGDDLRGFTETDIDSPSYRRTMDTLRAFQENIELSYIYCLRQTGDKRFEFIVDPTEDDPAYFGQEAQYTEALGTAGKGSSAVDLEAYTDQWGTFYSAYSPVFDSNDKIAGIVGVDFTASWYEDRVSQINRLLFLTCFASFGIALLAVFIAQRFSRAERQHSENMQRAELIDSLTGLPKLGRFLELAESQREEILAQGGEPAVLFFDLVGMRYFNHRQGFAEGDKLLKAFAELLRQYAGPERCGRVGQDQFAAIASTKELETKLDAFIADTARINDGNNLPVRIGIYSEELGRTNASTACDLAKAANEQNHNVQRSSYTYFDETMRSRFEQRRYVIDNIDRAIANNWIQVFYQPIVRASNGRVCDEESLARWIDPEHGMLSPAEFIPALEDAKLVYKLDLCVLEQTLAKMQSFAEAGLFIVPCSINLSRSDFEMCDIVEEVRERVDASGFGRDMVNIEITESDIGRDFGFMAEQIRRFHELGFKVWMDDFGSEYSSLDNLQSLNFDLIKFDMRFMQQFDNGSRTKVILTELMKMALGLGLDTICEGVETEEQIEFLREVGCSKLQGYYFTAPLPVDKVLERYETGTAIGFENPAETDYYTALSRVNLYDLSSLARDDDEGLENYFDTLPMAIHEATSETFRLIRCNPSYRLFLEQVFDRSFTGAEYRYEDAYAVFGEELMNALRSCAETDERVIVDSPAPNGAIVHAFARHIATNPVTHKAAVGVVILAVTQEEPPGGASALAD